MRTDSATKVSPEPPQLTFVGDVDLVEGTDQNLEDCVVVKVVRPVANDFTRIHVASPRAFGRLARFTNQTSAQLVERRLDPACGFRALRTH